jgi:uncharacterized cysteine cluster protein YcgN (CxxCxxCC family)
MAAADLRLSPAGGRKPLPHWHPLLSGSKAAMHGERISVRHIAVKEETVRDWQDHILNKPDWAQ